MDEKNTGSIRKPGTEATAAAGQAAQHTQPTATAQQPRKRNRGEAGKEAPVRYFTAEKSSPEGVPALTKEHKTEAEAIIASFESKKPFYRVETFTAATKVHDGAVVIDKVPCK